MSSQSLKLICDGEIEIVKITEDLYDAAIDLFYNYFIKYENLSTACNCMSNPDAVKEMITLIETILKDNISFAARDIKTNDLVAMCINKIVNPSAHISLDEVYKSFTTPNMTTIGNYIETLECTFDIFKEWQVDCVIELTFLSTRTDYGRRGIGLALAHHLFDYAIKLKENNTKESLDLPPHVKGQKPQAIMSAFTSRYSQIVGEKLGFTTLYQLDNSEFSFEGQTFAEKLDPIHKYSTFAAKKL